MSNQNDENQSNLVFILAIAGRIDAQSRIAAEELDKGRQIYYAYAVVDSLSSSYSMFKYFFDVCISSNNTDLMHDFMLTPTGITAITLESLFLVTFSVLACSYEKEEKDQFKKNIADAWPYFRDVIKALKNAYKGWRSAIQAVNTLGGYDLNILIAPVGVFLGILAAVNRYWIRAMLEERKGMMKTNTALLAKIKQLPTLSKEDSQSYIDQIQYQKDEKRTGAFVAVGIGGLIDGLYLYVGVLSLAPLVPAAFTAMAILCAFYTLACIVTRIFEEHDFQLRLVVTQTECLMNIIDKEMETNYAKLLVLMDKHIFTFNEILEKERLEVEVSRLIDDFEKKRSLLAQQNKRSYLEAGLLGVKNGLYCYSALASVLFLISTVFVMTSTAFPPALLIACVSLGMGVILGFVIHAVVMNYFHLEQQNEINNRPYDLILEMRKKLVILHELEEDKTLEAEVFNASIQDGLAPSPSPRYFFQEWFEVVRSFFSGIGKGQKFVDFAGNALQEQDEHGHYHDSPIMFILAIFSSFLFAITLGLRALARGLGRIPLGQQVDPSPLSSEVDYTSIDDRRTDQTLDSLSTPESQLASNNNEKVMEMDPFITEIVNEHVHNTQSVDDTNLIRRPSPAQNSIARARSDLSFFNIERRHSPMRNTLIKPNDFNNAHSDDDSAIHGLGMA